MKYMSKSDLEHVTNGCDCHQLAPRDWRIVPNITGDFDLDASILFREDKDLPDRLALYVRHQKLTYGPRTGYSSSHGYSGDD